MNPRPGEQLTPTARLGIRALRSERPWQSMASRQPRPSRLVDTGSRLVAVLALIAGIVTAGSTALHAL